MCKHCIGNALQAAATIAATEMNAHINIGDSDRVVEYAALTSGLNCLRIMLHDQPVRFIALMKTIIADNEDLFNAEEEVKVVDPNDCYWADIAATIAGA